MASNDMTVMSKYMLAFILVLLLHVRGGTATSADTMTIDTVTDSEESPLTETLVDSKSVPDNIEITEPDTDFEEDDFSIKNMLRSLIQPVIDEFKYERSNNEDVLPEKSENDEGPSLEIQVPKIENDTSQNEDVQMEEAKPVNESTTTAKKLKFQCKGKNLTDTNSTAAVRLVNSTELLHMLSFNSNDSDCLIVMFFAPWCHFSAQTAPHYNALGRAYPNLDVLAVDAAHFSNLNARFGTVSVPNILLFHQSRAVVKFNQTTRSFDNFVQFIKNLTGLEANSSVTLETIDYEGPLSSVPTEDTDYLLWLAWLFVCVCTIYMVTVSSTGQHIINRVNILWQEHQHIE